MRPASSKFPTGAAETVTDRHPRFGLVAPAPTLMA